ncbi:unnamed protein product [Haemonchus placei]|uniref:Recep_L_domain domain-containing protein n=1 Tax=Haemonchus placei TaxID=6290 RepID=A0A158QQH0_HAEPC|nr:unnamed protein product [Haemonchus placei]
MNSLTSAVANGPAEYGLELGRDRIISTYTTDESTDLTHEKLAELFQNVDTIDGALTIVNTSYRNVSFFKAISRIRRNIERIGYDLSIVNNTELTSIDELLFHDLLDVEISDNPLLALDCTHIIEYYSKVRRIQGNVNDCGCELDGALTQTTILAVEDNCELIYGDFILSGKDTPSSDVLEQKFGKATILAGQLLVMDTDIVDLSFLGKVLIVEKYLTSTGRISI